MVKSKENLLGAYSFLVGVILAIIFGFLSDSLGGANGLFYTAILVIGAIVGFMNVGDKDSHTFLLASLSIVIVGALGLEPLLYIAENFVVDVLRNILGSLLVLFVPATIIVALKNFLRYL
jgi:nitrate/nitrite transporter NarK